MDASSSRGKGSRFYQSSGRSGSSSVCKYFQSGTCNYGENCKFVHPGVPTLGSSRSPNGGTNQSSNWSANSGSSSRQFGNSNKRHSGSGSQREKSLKICKFWLQGDCRKGDSCQFYHAHTTAPDIEMVSEIKGHEKAVMALAFEESSLRLYSGSKDSTVRIWNTTTGQSLNEENVGQDVSSLLLASAWLFVGLPGQVKSYNMASGGAQASLTGPLGKVHDLKNFGEFLFGACEDGRILSWRFQAATSSFEPFISLEGHRAAVVIMQIIGGRLYSGSMDKTIRVWDLNSGTCIQVVEAHSDVVMGLCIWEMFLISASLDGTLKAWQINPSNGLIECTFSYPDSGESSGKGLPRERDGVLALGVAVDSSKRPVLFASFTDNSVRLFDLPSFTDRGALLTKEEVRTLLVSKVGEISIIFTGDVSGDIKAWRWI